MTAIKLLGDIILWTVGIIGIFFFLLGRFEIGMKKKKQKIIANGILRALFVKGDNPIFRIERLEPVIITCPNCKHEFPYEGEKNGPRLHEVGELSPRRRVR